MNDDISEDFDQFAMKPLTEQGKKEAMDFLIKKYGTENTLMYSMKAMSQNALMLVKLYERRLNIYKIFSAASVLLGMYLAIRLYLLRE